MPHFTFKRKSSAAPATLSGGERRLLPPLPPRRDIPGQLPARHLPEAYALPPPSRRVPPPGMRVPTPDAPAGAGIEGLLEPALDALAYPFGGVGLNVFEVYLLTLSAMRLT
jgi:hypothetical protein